MIYDEDGRRSDDRVLKEINAHGVSIVRVARGEDGTWGVVEDPKNRRITGGTPMEIAGPVRGSDHVKTKYSPDGTMTRGTLNNCAHGVTPWGTYLTCEENWAGYFSNTDAEMPREHDRYGVSDDPHGGRYGWHLAAGGADEFVRFNASPIGASADRGLPQRAERLRLGGRDRPARPREHAGQAHPPRPLRPRGRGVRAPPQAGQPVVAYAGDDARFEYIYKFVSAATYDPATTDGAILDEGTLYVAKFNDDGTGEWLALAPGENGLTPENGFADLADILVNTRTRRRPGRRDQDGPPGVGRGASA